MLDVVTTGLAGAEVIGADETGIRIDGGLGFVNTNAGSETRKEWRSCGLRCCMGDGGLLAL